MMCHYIHSSPNNDYTMAPQENCLRCTFSPCAILHLGLLQGLAYLIRFGTQQRYYGLRAARLHLMREPSVWKLENIK